VFKMTLQGKLTTLHNFVGRYPSVQLVWEQKE
jgi:hypothetical protein